MAFEPVGEPPPVYGFFDESLALPSTCFLDTRRNRLLFYGCFLAFYERVLDFYSFDLDTHEWQTLECMGACPTEVFMSAFTYVPSLDRGYLFGGLALNGVSSKIYMMDPESLFFTRLPSAGTLPMRRLLHSMILDENLNRLIVFGGQVIDRPINIPVEVNLLNAYDLETNEWSELTDIVTGIPPTPRRNAPLLALPRGTIDQNTYMLTFGGYDYPDRFDDLHCLRLYDYSADTTPPARVDDLGADLNDEGSHVRLHWTAPGDDGLSGRAEGYDVRLSTTPIDDEEDFEAASIVPVLYLPSFPGMTENLMFALPQSDITYHFALKAFDEAGNISELSNCARTVSRAIRPQGPAVLDGPLEHSRQDYNTAIHLEVSQ